LNSLQYIRTQCECQLAMVSEVPVALAPKLADLTPSNWPRRFLILQDIASRKDNLKKCRQILEEISPAVRGEQAMQRFQHYQRWLEWESSGVASREKRAVQMKGQQHASAGEVYRYQITKLLIKATRNAIAVKILLLSTHSQAATRQESYRLKFDRAFNSFESYVDYQLIPLKILMKLEMATILAGTHLS